MKNMFSISIEDVQNVALKEIDRKLTVEELKQVQKGVEFGLECWEEVVANAIEELNKN